ncbi:MAG: ParB N-terminal domain-containing protein [Thermoguttaceae bacterium]|nr:ParB N-terminal domain-containing protein [Thermoguttaceae bacterium]MBQ5788936.1 ParB N-terminal domain-containing protein [Thermoguttaceae bacterium]
MTTNPLDLREFSVELRPLGDVRPYENNPRINDGAVDAVAESIRRFGFRQPLVVDEDGVILAGHTRLKAAAKLGLERVPVVVATGLSPEAAREYRLADNKTAELADWDLPKLTLELDALRSVDADFDPLTLGFGADELARLLALGPKEGFTDPDDAPEVPATTTVKRGDMFRLGEHRLLCGDSTDAADVARLFDGATADLYLTDPPYNVDYTGSTGLKIANDSMDDADFLAFLTSAFCRANEVLRPGAAFYIWHADTEGRNFREAVRQVDWTLRECLIWVKNSLVLGRQDYQWRHEPCLYGWKGGAAHYWNGGRSQSTVFEIDKPRKNDVHPTMKPVELFERQMQNSTRPGDVVFDSFAGSGTTFVAAERLGRRCFGLELSPNYCDAIIQRWEAFTGEKAEVVR